MPRRRTKIVCTLGPAVDSRRAIARLIAAGMNVARLNCSHGDWETRARWIAWLRELSSELSPVGILVDLQGPKFRIGAVKGGVLDLKPGAQVIVGNVSGVDIPIPQSEIICELRAGDRLLLGDGNLELRIRSGTDGRFEASAVTAGAIRSRQGLTLVGKSFSKPAFTEQDAADMRWACELDADFVALSYVHSADDLTRARKAMDGMGGRMKLCAKIETRSALRNLEEILAASDLAMVARGDLGLQMNPEDVPMAQKAIIRLANRLGKPVITATQMLESMMLAPRPTRAEVADVANAILDGTDAVMLSGETATGAYPTECVRTMARIAGKAETMLDHQALLEGPGERGSRIPASHAIAQAVARLAETTQPRAILTTTTSGQTARLVSKFRPCTPILCATWNPKTHCQMSVVWGVESLHVPLPTNTDEIVQNAMDGFVRRRRLRTGDRVIVTAGVPAGTPGNTNLILNEVVK